MSKSIEVTLEELHRDRKKRKKIQEEIKKMVIPRREEAEKDEKEDN